MVIRNMLIALMAVFIVTSGALASPSKARQAYKKKNYAAAAKLYKAYMQSNSSFRNHDGPEALDYYQYAGALWVTKDLKGALENYQKSLLASTKHYKHHHTYYNMACVSSQLKNASAAQIYLRAAVARGYRAFKHIQKDKDIAWLRGQAGWATFFKNLKKTSLQKQDYVGTFKVLIGEESYTDIDICANGKFYYQHVPGDGMGGGSGSGTWKVTGKGIKLAKTKTDDLDGVREYLRDQGAGVVKAKKAMIEGDHWVYHLPQVVAPKACK